MSRSIQQATCVPNLKNLSWFISHDCKKMVWPTFGCKLWQSDPIVMQLKLDMSCHLLNVYTKFQIDISKHVEEKSGKRRRMDGWMDGHWHGIIRPFFKRAYKKQLLAKLVSSTDSGIFNWFCKRFHYKGSRDLADNKLCTWNSVSMAQTLFKYQKITFISSSAWQMSLLPI